MRHSSQPSTPQAEQLAAALQFAQWIAQNPDYAHLLNPVQHHAADASPLPRWHRLLPLLYLFLTHPHDLYGTAYVTSKVQTDAQVTARTITISNLIDFLTNGSLFFFAYQNLGNLPALVISSLINLGLLWTGNVLSVGTVRRRKGNQTWSKMAAIAMVSLNAVQSIVSGVGVELLNNRPALNALKAQQQIEQQIAAVQDLQHLDDPHYLAVKERCESAQAQLLNLERDHPRWDSLFVEINGPWRDQNRDWQNVPLEKLPLCRQVTRLETEAFQAYETAQANLAAKLVIRTDLGNDLLFLQQEYPHLYQQTFTEAGELRSGVEAAALAYQSFFGKLQRGDLAGVSFSLFFMALSVLTSAAACCMSLAYARRQDVQMTWNEAVQQERDRWLETHWQALNQHIHSRDRHLN